MGQEESGMARAKLSGAGAAPSPWAENKKKETCIIPLWEEKVYRKKTKGGRASSTLLFSPLKRLL